MTAINRRIRAAATGALLAFVPVGIAPVLAQDAAPTIVPDSPAAPAPSAAPAPELTPVPPTTGGPAVIDNSAATATKRAAGPASVADLAEGLLNSVVNVSTSQRVVSPRRAAPAPEGDAGEGESGSGENDAAPGEDPRSRNFSTISSTTRRALPTRGASSHSAPASSSLRTATSSPTITSSRTPTR